MGAYIAYTHPTLVNSSLVGLMQPALHNPDLTFHTSAWLPDAEALDFLHQLNAEGHIIQDNPDAQRLREKLQNRPKLNSRLALAKKYGAYRAPVGTGMVARGTYYGPGKFVPDMQGEFMNPKSRKGIDPERLKRIRKRWKVHNLGQGAANADGTSSPAPPVKKM